MSDATAGHNEAESPNASRWNLEKSLCYFEDAEKEPDPLDLSGQTWEQVKTAIQQSNKL